MAIGCKVYRKESCQNSLLWAKEFAVGAPDGALFLANHHEVTRGRQGRVWKQYPGQMLATILLKPSLLLELSSDTLPIRLNQLNMALALGINEVLEAYGSVIKWPNDFYICGKKVGGLLMEVLWRGERPQAMIMAFALNVNTLFTGEDELFPSATSLQMESGGFVDEDGLLNMLCPSLDRYYDRWCRGEFQMLFQEWREEQDYIGRELRVHTKDGSTMKGIMSDVCENGDMILDISGKSGKMVTIPFYIVDSLEEI
jgi:BirA family transcriptional regulator, biotin operon repressor / biotin---[acetyl-CoA-carboxylase] ligase